MTRVALLAPCTWPEVRRGGERLVRELASGLIERGHQPTLITSHPGQPSRTVEDGLEVIRNWRPPDGRLRRRLVEDYVTHVPFSYKHLNRGDYEIAHAFHAPDALAAVRWSRNTDRPAVFTFLGLPTRRNLVQRRGRLEAVVKAADGSAAVVALSKAAREGFRHELGIEARVIHPGVDLDRFQPTTGRDERPTIFCASDPAVEAKRVPLLIEAFKRVRKRRRRARLILQAPRDEALAATLADPDNGIELTRGDNLPELYSSAWTLALPSWGEAFGLVLTEALACGTPVVGTNDEVIDSDGIGRVFTGDDPKDLAKALFECLELANDPNTRERCRARAKDFSTGKATDAYLQLYEEVTVNGER
ncbi:MAG: glycosyltransferase family 4 protein [Thermoleophilaceae bacterium]